MDNSFGSRPPGPGQWNGQNARYPPGVPPQGYNGNVPQGMDPRVMMDPGFQMRMPAMNGYPTMRPPMSTPSSTANGYPTMRPPMSTPSSTAGFPGWDSMNIPSQMFMQAFNFDQMMGGGGQYQNAGDVSLKETPSHASSNMLNRTGDESQLREAGMDLIEQQQAMEQARLLQRFKQMRQWQQQQQEMLMSQQQQQLSLLRKEQQKVQQAISGQRDPQYGGSRQNAYPEEMMTPPRRQLAAGTDLAQMMSGSGHMGQSGHQLKPSLPRPVIYIQPKEDDDEIKTNPDLYSDTNSNRGGGSQIAADEGMFPIPDSASEASVDVQPVPRLMTKVHPRFNPHELDAPKKLHRSFAELEADEDFINQSYSSPTLDEMHHSKLDHRAMTNKSTASDIDEEEDEDSDEDGTEDEEDDDEEDSEEEEQDTQIEVPQASLDDVPIKPGVEGGKTFEQLLEEQLKAEEERLRQMEQNESSPSQPKRSFLKKGDGISRFESKPSQRPSRPRKPVPNTMPHAASQKGTAGAHKTGAGTSQKSGATASSSKVSGKPPSQPSRGGAAQSNQKQSSHNTQQKQKAEKGKKPVQGKAKESAGSTVGSASGSATGSGSTTGSAPALGKKATKAESIPDDTSFVASLKERQKESERDLQELDEFEILEDFADNMSFCSNSSIVTKGLRGLQSDRILTGVLPKTSDIVRPMSPRAALIKKLESEKQVKLRQTGDKHVKRIQSGDPNQPDKQPGKQPRRIQAVDNVSKPSGETRTVKSGKCVPHKDNVHDDEDDYESVSDSSEEESSSDSSEDSSDGNDDARKVTQRAGVNPSPNNRDHFHRVNVAKGFDDIRALESKGNSRNDSVLKNDSLLSTDKKLERVLSYTGFTETSVSRDSESELSSDSDSNADVAEDFSAGYFSMINKSATKAMTRKVAGRDDRTKPSSDNLSVNNDFLTANFNGSAFVPNPKSPLVISKEKVSVPVGGFSREDTKDVKFSYHSDNDSVGKSDFSDDSGSDFGDKAASSGHGSRVSEKKTLQFDDDDEWGDMSPIVGRNRQHLDSEGDNEHEKTITEEPERRPSTQEENALAVTTESNDDTPPTSKLVSKLFPKLKPVRKKQEEQELQKIQSVSQSAVGDGVQSTVLRDKLLELEREIEKFRNENAHLAKQRTERDEGLAKMKKEMMEFEKEKTEELKRLEDFRQEEMKKLRHERKMFDKYQKAMRAGPDKKEREEIETLKEQLTEVQEEMRRKESRWTSSTGRLRTKMDQLEQENSELREEIKIMEKKRLEWMQSDQSKGRGRPVAQNPLRSSTPTGDDEDRVGGEYLTNGHLHHEQLNDMSTTSSIRSTMSLKQSQQCQPRVNVHSSFPPNTKPSHPTHPAQHSKHTTNQSAKPHNHPAKGNQSKKTFSHNSKAGHVSQGPAQNKAGSKPGAKSSAGSKAGSHGDKNILRNSLSEEVPRRELGTVAQPQDVSMYSEADPDVSMMAPSNLPRKFAGRMGVDKSVIDKGDNDYEETQHSDGKVERGYKNGAREILFSNGTKKEISADGQSIVVSFFNGDVKQIMPDQRVVYYYADAQTTHSSYHDGLEILQFPNNQTEKLYPDGTKEITFPDQTVKYIFPNSSEESIFPDGTVIRLEKNGDKTMEFPNGQREIHTQEYKKREYPDGTVKTVYPDGRQETRYSNGRLRVKDKDGNIIIDRHC